jgi:hypothetical protein
MAILDITGPIVGASSAASGLILVYLGATVTAYQAYQPQERRTVKAKFQLRANFAFAALIVSVFAAIFALMADWQDQGGLAVASFGLLVISMTGVAITAFLSVREIV